MNSTQRKAFDYTMGICICLGRLLVFAFILIFIHNLLGFNTDDSDKSKWKKSNFKLHIDYKTGLQYFSTRQGHITPRLNIDGTQMRLNR